MSEISQIRPVELWEMVQASLFNEPEPKTAKVAGQPSDVQPLTEGVAIDPKTLKVPKLGNATMPVPSLTAKAEPNVKNVTPVTSSKESATSIDKADPKDISTQSNEERPLHESTAEDFSLDRAEPLTPGSFPNPPATGQNRLPATIPNLQYMLNRYGIRVRYNTIKKQPEFIVPGLITSPDNIDNVVMTQVKSLARLNNISVAGVEETVLAIADRQQYNPVADWIRSRPWDGIDRLQDFYDTVTENEDFPKEFKERLIYRWMLSAVAAVFMPVGFRARGVLTFQGVQSIGKTAWISALISDVALRESVVKLDHHMDAGDKDSKMIAATHLFVEIGELESSFRRDVARLKGFITSDYDKIRLPYARTVSNFPRRSVFCATVNDAKFLVDLTGNTRWWVIPVTKMNYQHDIDMQQLWAQLAVAYENGEQWWLTDTEEKILESYNKDHRVASVVEERVMPLLDLNRSGEDGLPAMTPTELLMKVGYKYVTNPQAKECGALLREHLGEPKKIQGYLKWRIPFANTDDITSIDDY